VYHFVMSSPSRSGFPFAPVNSAIPARLLAQTAACYNKHRASSGLPYRPKQGVPTARVPGMARSSGALLGGEKNHEPLLGG